MACGRLEQAWARAPGVPRIEDNGDISTPSPIIDGGGREGAAKNESFAITFVLQKGHSQRSSCRPAEQNR